MKKTDHDLHGYLTELMLNWPREHYEALAQQAAQEHWTHVDYLTRLLEGECLRRKDNRIQRRLRAARFPVLKSLDSFNWSWPKKINRPEIQNLFRLQFLEQNSNVIFLGGVGLGKTHLATALGYTACLEGHAVLFTTAVDMINTLAAAQAAQRLKQELKRYLAPRLLILDELGYLPIDKLGADLLFQVISQRYERGSIVLTTNQPYKHWAKIFNNDSTLTSAVLDRLLHHADTVLIEGKSYRMKDQIEAP
jgi:DNA replication protein DnaC